MYKNLLILLFILVWLSPTAVYADDFSSPERVMAGLQKLPDDFKPPEQVVTEFQNIHHIDSYDLPYLAQPERQICEKGGKTKIFKTFFSKELYKFLRWSQCGDPAIPPRYAGINAKLEYDIRYGFPPVDGRDETVAEVQPVILQGDNKAIVKVFYGSNKIDALIATYTLIREDSIWKIDDIATQANYDEEDSDRVNDVENTHSDSIKTDMQTNYKAAVERYKKRKQTISTT